MEGDIGAGPDMTIVQRPVYHVHFPFLVLEHSFGSSLASKAEMCLRPLTGSVSPRSNNFIINSRFD